MKFKELMDKLQGTWEGEYMLWINPSVPRLKSKSVCQISNVVLKNYIQLEYSWEYEEEKQEGLLIVSFDEKKEKVLSSWIDSWHQNPAFMSSEGSFSTNGSINVLASYEVSEGPNWQWRTKIIPKSENNFVFEMYNILPTGEEHLAVQVEYSRMDT